MAEVEDWELLKDVLCEHFNDRESLTVFLTMQEQELQAALDATLAADLAEADLGCVVDDVTVAALLDCEEETQAFKRKQNIARALDDSFQIAHDAQFAKKLEEMDEMEWNASGDLEENTFEVEPIDWAAEAAEVANMEKGRHRGGDCQICLETQPFLREFAKCGHAFCGTCIGQSLRIAMQGKDVPATCPAPACEEEAGMDLVSLYLPSSALTEYMQLAEEAKIVDKVYCPVPHCSKAQEREIEKGPRKQCVECGQHFCTKCEVVWHPGQTCAEYQAYNAPVAEYVFQMGKKEKWCACPDCGNMISKTEDSCNHVRCRCRCEFCYRCGAKYENDIPQAANVHGKAGCDCPLFNFMDEDEEEDDEEDDQNAPPPPPVPILPIPEPWQPLNYGRRIRLADCNVQLVPRWLRHRIRNRQCEYCAAVFANLVDLDQHLNGTSLHPVYACCGRIFQNAKTLKDHKKKCPGARERWPVGSPNL